MNICIYIYICLYVCMYVYIYVHMIIYIYIECLLCMHYIIWSKLVQVSPSDFKGIHVTSSEAK